MGTNAWTNPTNAYSDNTVYATCAPGKNLSVAGIWTTFGITDPGSATLSDVTVIAQYKTSTTASIASLTTEISWDGGTTWDAGDTDASEPAADYNYSVSKWADTTWDWTKLNNTNLKVLVMGIRGNSNTAVTFSLDVVQVQVTYTVVTAISVTDVIAAADSILRGKAFTQTDTITLADSKTVNKTLPLSDTVTLADSKSVDKTLTETDAITLADSKLVNKTIPLTDTITLADIISELTKLVLKNVTDTITLADSVLRDKSIVISESIGLADSDLRNKTLTETDAIALLDTILLLAQKNLTDTVQASDLAAVDKLLEILDSIGLDDAVDVDKTGAPPVVVPPTGGGSSIIGWWTPDKPETKKVLPKPRLIIIEDVIHLADDVRVDLKDLLQRESVQLIDRISLDKRITITDSVHLEDVVYRHRAIFIMDAVKLADMIERDITRLMASGAPVSPVVRERALEVAERIREFATDARSASLWARLHKSADPSLTMRVSNSYARELTELFRKFRGDVEKITGERNLADGDFGDIDAEDWMDQLKRSMEFTIIIDGKKIVVKYTRQGYKSGGLRSTQFLSTLGVNASFGMLPVDKNALDVLELRSVSGLEGITDDMSKEIMRAITDGMIAGDNPRDIAKAIVDRVDSIGISRAETLARTEVMTAYNVGARVQYSKYGITQKKWLTAMDDRTCDECNALDGEVFDMDEEPRAPLHPNCRCIETPVIPELPSDMEE